MADVFVCGQQQIVTGIFGFLDQIAVLEFVLPQFPGKIDFVS